MQYQLRCLYCWILSLSLNSLPTYTTPVLICQNFETKNHILKQINKIEQILHSLLWNNTLFLTTFLSLFLFLCSLVEVVGNFYLSQLSILLKFKSSIAKKILHTFVTVVRSYTCHFEACSKSVINL